MKENCKNCGELVELRAIMVKGSILYIASCYNCLYNEKYEPKRVTDFKTGRK